MLIQFQSEASGDVLMFGDVARQMMEIIGKDPAARGVVTLEELPAAIGKLIAAIGADTRPVPHIAANDEEEGSISITQRALPLLALFEHSLKREVAVLWGIRTPAHPNDMQQARSELMSEM